MPRDVRGRLIDLPNVPRRVVSLVPSITETLFDLGAGDAVAAVTDYCIFPEEQVAGVERIGGTKNPKVELVREIAPDLVHANLEENLRRHVEAIEKFAPVFVSEPKSVADVVTLLGNLGTMHGAARRASQYAAFIDREVQRAEGRARFRFACPIWKEPWMWCGGDTYVANLVEAAGGVNVLADLKRYPTIAPREVLALDPDIVFLPDEPFAFSTGDAEWLQQQGAARVVGPFEGHLFTWHGTRTLLGLRFLRSVLERPAAGRSDARM